MIFYFLREKKPVTNLWGFISYTCHRLACQMLRQSCRHSRDECVHSIGTLERTRYLLRRFLKTLGSQQGLRIQEEQNEEVVFVSSNTVGVGLGICAGHATIRTTQCAGQFTGNGCGSRRGAHLGMCLRVRLALYRRPSLQK